MKLFVIAIFLIQYASFADSENWDKNTATVGEPVVFKWEGKGELEVTIGHFYNEEESDIPLGEVVEIKNQTHNSGEAKIVYFAAGEHKAPLQWIQNGKRVYPESIIKIESSLLGNETELLPESPPQLISSFRYWLLGFYILLVLGALYSLVWLYGKWERREKVIDANWAPIQTLDSLILKENHFFQFLNQESISFKALAFRYSELAKLKISKMIGNDLEARTDNEFLVFVFDRTKGRVEEFRELRLEWQELKYKDTDRYLDPIQAKLIVSKWSGVLFPEEPDYGIPKT